MVLVGNDKEVQVGGQSKWHISPNGTSVQMAHQSKWLASGEVGIAGVSDAMDHEYMDGNK